MMSNACMNFQSIMSSSWRDTSLYTNFNQVSKYGMGHNYVKIKTWVTSPDFVVSYNDAEYMCVVSIHCVKWFGRYKLTYSVKWFGRYKLTNFNQAYIQTLSKFSKYERAHNFVKIATLFLSDWGLIWIFHPFILRTADQL